MAKAFLTDVCPLEHRQLAIGYLSASYSLARVIGAAVIGVVFTLGDHITGWLKFSLPCFVASVPLIVTGVLLLIWLPSDSRVATLVKEASKRRDASALVVISPGELERRVSRMSVSLSLEYGDAERLAAELKAARAEGAPLLDKSASEHVMEMSHNRSFAGASPVVMLDESVEGFPVAVSSVNTSTRSLPMAGRHPSDSKLVSSAQSSQRHLAHHLDEGESAPLLTTAWNDSVVKGSTSTATLARPPPTAEKLTMREGLRIIAKDFNIMWLTIIYSVNSFCNGAILVLLVLQLALPKAQHGYGKSPSGCSAAVALFGVLCVVFQVSTC